MPENSDSFKKNTHIRLKVSGSSDKVSLFHFIIANIDSDYPVGRESLACPHCKGLTWYSPVLDRGEICDLATQVNEYKLLKGRLKMKIRHMDLAMKCYEKTPPFEPDTVEAAADIPHGLLMAGMA